MQSTWIFKSKRFWGMFITTATVVLPALGPYIGWDISPALVADFGEKVNALLSAFGGVFGVILTWYGSAVAKGPMVVVPE